MLYSKKVTKGLRTTRLLICVAIFVIFRWYAIGLQYLLVIEMTSGCKLKEEIENIYKNYIYC